MYPVLFKYGTFTIHTYGFFIALAVIAGMYLSRYEADKLGLDPERVMDATFYVVVAAILGARIFYIATNLEYFMSDPLEMLKIWNGGLVFYGGFIGSTVVLLIYLWIYHLPLGKMADIAGLALPLGQAIGRIGCFFAGCCYGKLCHEPWSITFTNKDSLAPLFVPLHPTELYSSVTNLLIFVFIFAIRRFKKYDGQVFWIYVVLYGVTRSIIEVFRGDFRGASILHTFSISQTIGLSSASVAFIMLIILGVKHSKS